MDRLPKPMTARLARHYRAIQEARGEGYTWDQILVSLVVGGIVKPEMTAKALGIAFARTKKAIQAGRFSVRQEPLPGWEDEKPKPVSKQPVANHQSQQPSDGEGKAKSSIKYL